MKVFRPITKIVSEDTEEEVLSSGNAGRLEGSKEVILANGMAISGRRGISQKAFQGVRRNSGRSSQGRIGGNGGIPLINFSCMTTCATVSIPLTFSRHLMRPNSRQNCIVIVTIYVCTTGAPLPIVL